MGLPNHPGGGGGRVEWVLPEVSFHVWHDAPEIFDRNRPPKVDPLDLHGMGWYPLGECRTPPPDLKGIHVPKLAHLVLTIAVFSGPHGLLP